MTVSIDTHLNGRTLLIARVVWVITYALALIITVYQFSYVPDVAASLYAKTRAALQVEMNPFTETLLLLTLRGTYRPFIISLSFFASGIWLFYKRPYDQMAIHTSLMLGSLSAFNPITNLLTWNFLGELPLNPFWLSVCVCLMALTTSFGISLLYMFPNGKFVPEWTRRLLPIIPVLGLGYALAFMFTGTTPLLGFFIGIFPILLGGIASLVYRFQNTSVPLHKQQVKWLAIGALCFLIFQTLGVVNNAFLPQTLHTLRDLCISALNEVLFLIAYLGLGITLSWSILRYRVWDLDYVLNRSLVYSLLTVLLGGIFAAGFFAVRALVEASIGSDQVLLAAVLPAVAITALFSPARRVLRSWVDKQFYGIKIEYATPGRQPLRSAQQGAITGIGKYMELEFIASGGMGEVYRAQDSELKRAVAIKVLPRDSSTQSDAYKRFVREAQTISGLKHPNIVTLYDMGEQDGLPYMVMKYVDGKTLSQLIHQHGRLSLNEALPIFTDIAAGLEYAHTQGVIHRDIKPSNVMIEKMTATDSGKNSRAVLMDFGIAKTYTAATRLTKSGIIGTLDYISPEQIQAGAEVDMRADIYSFGVMAYQILTGRLPFEHDNPGAIVMAHLMQPAPDPREIMPELPEDAANALLKAMSKRAADRFASAGEFIKAMG